MFVRLRTIADQPGCAVLREGARESPSVSPLRDIIAVSLTNQGPTNTDERRGERVAVATARL